LGGDCYAKSEKKAEGKSAEDFENGKVGAIIRTGAESKGTKRPADG